MAKKVILSFIFKLSVTVVFASGFIHKLLEYLSRNKHFLLRIRNYNF